jgi:hypothetical protein
VTPGRWESAATAPDPTSTTFVAAAHKPAALYLATDSGSLSALEQAMQDLDPVETQEWLDALESVLDR